MVGGENNKFLSGSGSLAILSKVPINASTKASTKKRELNIPKEFYKLQFEKKYLCLEGPLKSSAGAKTKAGVKPVLDERTNKPTLKAKNYANKSTKKENNVGGSAKPKFHKAEKEEVHPKKNRKSYLPHWLSSSSDESSSDLSPEKVLEEDSHVLDSENPEIIVRDEDVARDLFRRNQNDDDDEDEYLSIAGGD